MSDSRVEKKIFNDIFVSLSHLSEEQITRILGDLKLNLDKGQLGEADFFYLSMMLAHEDDLLAEKALVDWTIYELKQSEAISFRIDEQRLFVAPDGRILKLKFDHIYHGLEAGIWALKSQNGGISKMQLQVPHALILDTLNEDRKFTERQLLDFLLIEKEGIEAIELLPQYRQALSELKTLGFVLEGAL
ncbi:MAG: hypothetical protein ACLGGX_06310 [Bdellovibrionia bacterium]